MVQNLCINVSSGDFFFFILLSHDQITHSSCIVYKTEGVVRQGAVRPRLAATPALVVGVIAAHVVQLVQEG